MEAAYKTDYRIRIERRNIKNLNLYLRPPYEEVLVTVPKRMPEGRIQAFIREKTPWIELHLRRLRAEKHDNLLEHQLTAEERNAYKNRLEALLPPMLAEWEERISVHAERFSLRKMRRCFGVCHTARREITFNLMLGNAPEALIEYIVVHELVHLLEPSHNRRFHELMDRFLPDWRKRKREINHFYSGTAGDTERELLRRKRREELS